MMLPDLDLPCKTNYLAFEAVIDLSENVGPHSPQRTRTENAAKKVCATCPYTLRCLQEFANEPGVIGGMSHHERVQAGIADAA